MKKFWIAVLVPALLLGATISGLITPSRAQSPAYYRGGGDRHELVWSGDVDDTTVVALHGYDVRTRDVHGKASINVNSQLYGRLPQGPLVAFIKNWDGRGYVQVVRQPNPNNNFTAAVRIYDPQPGRGHYDFVLGWAPRNGAVQLSPF